MKCPKCNGTGKENILMGLNCDMCNGTGEVEATNEEWFCSLSTEEKAKRIINIAVNSNCDYKTIVEWLTAVHEDA